MADLISRQAAIDALREHRALYCDNTPDTFSKLSYAEKCRVDELDTAIATLINLPSAQPEKHLCRDCKWVKYYGNVDKNGNVESYWHCRNWYGGTDEEGYCHEWKSR